ncbi:MAG TPA: PqqD family protein [Gemmatimonadaceae bacterium]|nr:PqqD family protein [Gemmatimonadaceae bacterium]
MHRAVAGEHLLVALHRTRTTPLFSLNETGAELWERLSQWATAEELSAHLVELFDVSADVAAGDVAAFLSQLETIGALESRERAK